MPTRASPRTRLRALLVAAFGVQSVPACRPELDPEKLADNCETYCDTLMKCPFNNNPNESAEDELASIMRCSDGCVEEGERSLEIGRRCAAAHDEYVACLVPLTCDEFWDWGKKSAAGYPCDAAEREFFAECPGIREDL